MINITRLTDELTSAGMPVTGCAALPAMANISGYGNATFYTRAEGVIRVDWQSAPSPAQEIQAGAIVATHDGAPTEGERLDGVPLPARALAALALRTSSQWAGLSAARKVRVQAVIDTAADQVIARLT